MRKYTWLFLGSGLLLLLGIMAVHRWQTSAFAQPQAGRVYYFPVFHSAGRVLTDIVVENPGTPSATPIPATSTPMVTPLPLATPAPTQTKTPAATASPTKTPTAVPTQRPFPRHGVAVANWENVIEQAKRLGDWSHQWYAYNGEYPDDHEIVPMLVFSTSFPETAVIAEIDRKTDEATGHDYWLLFNECEAWQQCNKLPEEQAQLYGEQILPAVAIGDPNAKLIIGGSIADNRGLTWINSFVHAYKEKFGEEPPRAGWHFHIYPEVESSPTIEHFIRDAERLKHWLLRHGSPEDEVWLTEIGCLDKPKCLESEAYMLDILNYLNSEEGTWIDRYAWFTTYTDPDCFACGDSPGTHLVYREAPHELTELGELYANYFELTPTPTPSPTAVFTPSPVPTGTAVANEP